MARGMQPKKKSLPKQATGISPKLDEGRILNTLSNLNLMLTPNGARSLCSLVMLACYDRSVEREFMASIIDKCAEISQCLADLECVGRMYCLLQSVDPEKEPTHLGTEAERLSNLFVSQRKWLAENFALVCQCPTENDKIS